MNFQKVTEKDIPQLFDLVEASYRGDIARQGWTCESDIVGGNRTSKETLKDEINVPGGCYLKHCDDRGEIIGCVYIKVNTQDRKAFVGSLCVYPTLQSQGLGKQLLAATEVMAKEAGCSKLCVKVITKRTELINWYERMDFKFVGELIPLPDGSGVPIVPLQLGTWEKLLD